MAGPLNAKVILARCSKTRKTFGIRIEQRNGDWVRTWAFPIDEHKAKREGFDAETVSGSLKAVSGYPGCPHCGGIPVAPCSCGKIFCAKDWAGKEMELTCPWCGRTAVYSPREKGEKIDVSSGDY
jgi:hypothetical protein